MELGTLGATLAQDLRTRFSGELFAPGDEGSPNLFRVNQSIRPTG